VEETPSGNAFRKGLQEMAEDGLFCERPAKMANFRLAFDTRARKLLDGVDKRTDRDSEASNIRIGLLRRTATSCRKTT
jgi:hypothetical protein